MQRLTELARVRYWQGQLLASGDLQTQLATDEELRRLHNRTVHRAYGIAIGLGAALEAGAIRLTCGMAYDCAGRGLIVERDRAIPLPVSVIGPMTLTLSYDPAAADGTALSWVPAPQIRPNAQVAITRIIPSAGSVEIDPAFRPVVARPLARPQLATGTTVPGQTSWQPWTIDGVEIGVQVEVDTSAAGYTATPHYFAQAVPGQASADFVPAWFTSIADPSPESFTLQLMLRRITRETLDIAHPNTQVADPPTLDRTISLTQGNVMVRYDQVSRLLPLADQISIVKSISGSGIATLDQALSDFTGTKTVAWGNLPRVVGVTGAAAGSPEVQVDSIDQVGVHDLVARLATDGTVSAPVRIENIVKSSKKLILSSAITGLAVRDSLAVADFRVRATVLSASGTTVTVNDATAFPQNGVIASIDDSLQASLPATVLHVAGNTLTLDAPITGLAPAAVLALCAFPVTAQVQTIQPDGSLIVVGGTIRAADVVSAANHLAIVGAAGGGILRLAAALPNLSEGDTLTVATIQRTVEVAPASGSNPNRLNVPSEVRVGDFLADITGWRQATPGTAATAPVTAASANTISVTSLLGGLLKNDTVGLADLSPPILRLRLNSAADLVPGDEVLLVGLNRLTGETKSLFAAVLLPFKSGTADFVLLGVEGASETFALRGEDIAASVLFLRGSALALIQNQDLYVSWLACGDPDPMPRPYAGPDMPDCPCAFAKEL
jgi:hypothetical protein